MKLNYNFDQFEPPHLTSQKLQAMTQQRRLARRALVLIAASNFINICLILAAFYLAPFSLMAGIACLILFGVSLSGSGVVAVLSAKKWSSTLRRISNADFSITY